MSSPVHSLQTKLTLSFVVLILVIAGMTFLITFQETKRALKDQMRRELMSVASALAAQVDGDAHDRIAPGGEAGADYRAIQRMLVKAREANPSIRFVYTMRRSGQGTAFVVDADWGTDTTAAAVGEAYPEGEANRQLQAGFQRTSADDDFTTDEWGVVLSGYSPILTAQGKPAGLLGVDMDSKLVLERQRFIGRTIYLVVGIAVLIAGLIIVLFSSTIIRDLKKLIAGANGISMGRIDTRIDIRRKDEIGELAESFSRMEASLRIMMAEHETQDSQEPPKA